MKIETKLITVSDSTLEDGHKIIEQMIKLGMSLDGEFESLQGPYYDEKNYDNLFVLKYVPKEPK